MQFVRLLDLTVEFPLALSLVFCVLFKHAGLETQHQQPKRHKALEGAS